MTSADSTNPAREAGHSVWTAALAGLAASLELLVLACALSGCGMDYASSDPAFPGDFQARHPIALVSAPTSMDVYPVGGRLDPRTIADLRAFAGHYREFGSGAILILTPGRPGSNARAVNEIRAALSSGGARGRVEIGSYAPSGRDDAPPIRVSFLGLKAEVKTPCGLWPEDLASGSSLEGWKNEPYYNFGCANQSVLAAQVADPRDFVQARALGSSDAAMRMRAIEAVREGKEPSTEWKQTKLCPLGTYCEGNSDQ